MIVVTFFTEMLVMPPIPLDRTDEAAPGGCLPENWLSEVKT
jgi:hypothetical protein